VGSSGLAIERQVTGARWELGDLSQFLLKK
jgi:hypothetical protein